MPPIEAAEFDAHRDLSSIIFQFLCRNKDKGFSAREIAENTGISEGDIVRIMVKIGLIEAFKEVSSSMLPSIRRSKVRIEDVTVNGVIYYRCVELNS